VTTEVQGKVNLYTGKNAKPEGDKNDLLALTEVTIISIFRVLNFLPFRVLLNGCLAKETKM